MTAPEFVYSSKVTSRPDNLYRPSPVAVFRQRVTLLGVDLNEFLEAYPNENIDIISFLSDEKSIDTGIALKLEELTKVSAKYWLYVQNKYDLSLRNHQIP